MMRTKAFTLIEVLIALMIAGILFALIFKSYVSITQISTRLQNEKMLNAELTYMTETVQNIADTYQIDYARYGSTLLPAQGRTNALYLTGGSASGAALMISGNNLLWLHDNLTTELLSSGTVLLSAGKFHIIPFTAATTGGTAFLDVQHPGFRLFANVQLKKYNPKERMFNVQTSMQQFYNLQRIE